MKKTISRIIITTAFLTYSFSGAAYAYNHNINQQRHGQVCNEDTYTSKKANANAKNNKLVRLNKEFNASRKELKSKLREIDSRTETITCGKLDDFVKAFEEVKDTYKSIGEEFTDLNDSFYDIFEEGSDELHEMSPTRKEAIAAATKACVSDLSSDTDLAEFMTKKAIEKIRDKVKSVNSDFKTFASDDSKFSPLKNGKAYLKPILEDYAACKIGYERSKKQKQNQWTQFGSQMAGSVGQIFMGSANSCPAGMQGAYIYGSPMGLPQSCNLQNYGYQSSYGPFNQNPYGGYGPMGYSNYMNQMPRPPYNGYYGQQNYGYASPGGFTGLGSFGMQK